MTEEKNPQNKNNQQTVSAKTTTTEAWYSYQMVAQDTVCTYEINQVFQFVKCIWLHRKSRQTQFIREKNVRNMF